MSFEPPATEPDAPEAHERKRAAWALGGMALGAGVIVLLMVVFLGHSGGSDKQVGIPPISDLPTSPSTSITTHATTSPPATHSSTPAKTRSTTATATATGTPGTPSCPTSAKCTIQGDPGNAVAALNAFRTAHHLAAVTGSVSAQAQTCAMNDGNMPPCPSSYYWEPVPKEDGAAVVAKIAKKSNGPGFLLDPKMTSAAVGWAFTPGGELSCVIVTSEKK